MRTQSFGGRGVAGTLTAALLLLSSCSAGRGSNAPDPLLPEYSPEAASIFDDVFAPAAFGFDPEGRQLAKDVKLRERIRTADFVLPARVETISRVGGVEHTGSYELTLAPNGPPLLGEFDGGPIVLSVAATSPSYAWVDGAGAAWVGSRLLVFGRHYRGQAEPGRPALHFRCEPDTKEVRSIIERDAGLRALRYTAPASP